MPHAILDLGGSGTGSAGRMVDRLDLLLIRKSPPRVECLRRLGGRDAAQQVIAGVTGGVFHTRLGRGGGLGSVVDDVFPTIREVVAEGESCSC